ncbi:MAG TPA: hypothetical protein PLO28_09195 [bacterium]|jgi:hypothetical protein|nr:hypothetical protein [bacterium]HOZ21944.1 hypothetical protein [bacterium]
MALFISPGVRAGLFFVWLQRFIERNGRGGGAVERPGFYVKLRPSSQGALRSGVTLKVVIIVDLRANFDYILHILSKK